MVLSSRPYNRCIFIFYSGEIIKEAQYAASQFLNGLFLLLSSQDVEYIRPSLRASLQRPHNPIGVFLFLSTISLFFSDISSAFASSPVNWVPVSTSLASPGFNFFPRMVPCNRSHYHRRISFVCLDNHPLVSHRFHRVLW